MSAELSIQDVRRHRCPDVSPCEQEHLDVPRDDDEIIGVMIYDQKTDTKVQVTLEGFVEFLTDVIGGRYDKYLPEHLRRVSEPLTDETVEIDLNPPEPIFKDMPNPTDADIASPQFNAIWSAIKSWDVNVPECYELYCGANGSHVMLILNALRNTEAETEVEADRQAAIARGELD
jgi:hypothetical protein